ncbi:hypothetical protein ZIOFF_007740 [Zingiber officinale]|uniref:IST1-like protein n=1 Tax=Zingiber officinale TaxID=94328 RepID=A0A8J5LWQ5_ZINOF|nr:hypothetical protein ZIOFF_007740 [Zingiber officinale]
MVGFSSLRSLDSFSSFSLQNLELRSLVLVLCSKAEARMAMSRIKLLQNKREAQVRQMRQMRRDVALLLESGRDETARIRVEHVIREQNVITANDIIELFCELIVARLPIIAKQRDCPRDLKEGISSLIYASPRCSDIPELSQILLIFEKKYGKDFVSAATELRPESELIEKLSVKKPIGEVKRKVLKEIAKERQVEWDSAESEKELLVHPEKVINCPRTLSCTHTQTQKELQFGDHASAAHAISEYAEKAIHSEQAAAHPANQNSHPFDRSTTVDTLVCKCKKFNQVEFQEEQELDHLSGTHAPSNYDAKALEKRLFCSQSFSLSNTLDDDSIDSANLNEKKDTKKEQLHLSNCLFGYKI